MKTTISFSVDNDLVANFLALVSEKGYNKNVVVTTLIGNWMKDASIKFIVCQKCNSQYSEKLQECPQCKIERIKNEKREALKDMDKKILKMEKWVKDGKARPDELEILKVEYAALEKEVSSWLK